jgi:hypothetical protein
VLILTRKEPAATRGKEPVYEPCSDDVIQQLEPASLQNGVQLSWLDAESERLAQTPSCTQDPLRAREALGSGNEAAIDIGEGDLATGSRSVDHVP